MQHDNLKDCLDDTHEAYLESRWRLVKARRAYTQACQYCDAKAWKSVVDTGVAMGLESQPCSDEETAKFVRASLHKILMTSESVLTERHSDLITAISEYQLLMMLQYHEIKGEIDK